MHPTFSGSGRTEQGSLIFPFEPCGLITTYLCPLIFQKAQKARTSIGVIAALCSCGYPSLFLKQAKYVELVLAQYHKLERAVSICPSVRNSGNGRTGRRYWPPQSRTQIGPFSGLFLSLFFFKQMRNRKWSLCYVLFRILVPIAPLEKSAVRLMLKSLPWKH